MLIGTSIIGQFVHPLGGDGVKELDDGDRYFRFTLLEYIIIWYKIQVIVNPFVSLTLKWCLVTIPSDKDKEEYELINKTTK